MSRRAALLFGALVASNVWLVQRVLWPVRRLAKNAQNLSEGDLSAFESSCGGIAEVDTLRRSMLAMAGHVQRSQQQSRAYTDALSDGQEEERTRLARELHDDTIQSLIAIAQSIDVALSTLNGDSEKVRPLLETARTQAVESVTNLRRVIADLRPPALDELGLIPALRMLAGKIDDVAFEMRVSGTERRLDPGIELALYRTAHEALSNARRHAQARHITLTVTFSAEATQIVVEDDGRGFLWPPPAGSLSEKGHFGLIGMAERVQRFGGTLRVQTAPAQGTRIEILIPTERAAQPADKVRDPVCSALIAPEQAYGSVEHNGTRYYFCCPVCQGTFLRNPEDYVSLVS